VAIGSTSNRSHTRGTKDRKRSGTPPTPVHTTTRRRPPTTHPSTAHHTSTQPPEAYMNTTEQPLGHCSQCASPMLPRSSGRSPPGNTYLHDSTTQPAKPSEIPSGLACPAASHHRHAYPHLPKTPLHQHHENTPTSNIISTSFARSSLPDPCGGAKGPTPTPTAAAYILLDVAHHSHTSGSQIVPPMHDGYSTNHTYEPVPSLHFAPSRSSKTHRCLNGAEGKHTLPVCKSSRLGPPPGELSA
jgi:hypothetical protein